MGMLLALDVLQDVSLCLISQVVSTTLNTAVTPGSNVVTPPSTVGIFTGCLLVVGSGTAAEVVTVTATSATTFTAVFAAAHSGSELLRGATFSEGVSAGDPPYTTAEVLGYLADAQQELLLATRCIYAMSSPTLPATVRFNAQPSNCIRLERISIDGVALLDTTTDALDNNAGAWESASAGPPQSWFQDKTNSTFNYGVTPPPGVGTVANLFYSITGPKTLGLLDTFLTPDPLIPALKYNVLAQCFNKAGEERDEQRAQLCDQMYAFWVKLAIVLMEGTDAQVQSGM